MDASTEDSACVSSGETRAVVALSSAEAELGAAVKARQEKSLEVENRFKTSGRMDA